VLGDSLSAGLGLSPQEAFPALLQRKIDADGLKFEVINAGVSGDTSAGGLRRLDWALDGDVQVLILGLGANDGLRGLSVDEMRKNLSTIVERAQARHITVVLCGMEAPPNFGASYTTAFRAAYKDIAAKYDVAFVPFLLDGVAGLADLNQEDGIHPNARGAQRVADTVWSTLRPLLLTKTASPS
jgi:acyl-CoA thioesterase I